MNSVLKVTPEKLTQAATEFQNAGQNISSITTEMMNIVEGMKTIWQGEAATGFTNRFTALKDDIEKINSMIREHVSDLNEMAAEYQRAEEESTQQSNSLATDVIN